MFLQAEQKIAQITAKAKSIQSDLEKTKLKLNEISVERDNFAKDNVKKQDEIKQVGTDFAMYLLINLSTRSLSMLFGIKLWQLCSGIIPKIEIVPSRYYLGS